MVPDDRDTSSSLTCTFEATFQREEDGISISVTLQTMAMEEMHGHTSNSAEVHNYRDDVLVYSNVLDGHETYPKEGPGLLIERKYDIMSTHMTITVGDEFLHINNNRGVSCSYQSPYLFTLRGQKPTYGNVNYDIFFSMNRVVYPYSYTSRTGVGLCKAVIKAVDYEIQYGTPPTISPIKQ